MQVPAARDVRALDRDHNRAQTETQQAAQPTGRTGVPHNPYTVEKSALIKSIGQRTP